MFIRANMALTQKRIRDISNNTEYPRLTELILKSMLAHRYIIQERIGLVRFVENKSKDEVAEQMNKIYDHIKTTDEYATFYAILKKPCRVNKDLLKDKSKLNENRPKTYRKNK